METGQEKEINPIIVSEDDYNKFIEPVIIKCLQCNKVIIKKREWHKFCERACKVKWNNDKKCDRIRKRPKKLDRKPYTRKFPTNKKQVISATESPIMKVMGVIDAHF